MSHQPQNIDVVPDTKACRGGDNKKDASHSLQPLLVDMDSGPARTDRSGKSFRTILLNWRPDTDLKLVRIDDEVSSHALIGAGDNSGVGVLPLGEDWPVREADGILKDG
jgi:hypothetical protein